jgi:nucleotide-binding universal stress UspA family protein
MWFLLRLPLHINQQLLQGGLVIAIEKILIPTDFSEYSRWATRYAVAFAKKFKARLYVMHVFEEVVFSVAPDGYSPSVSDFHAALQRSERNNLDLVIEDLCKEGVDAEPVFKVGRAYIDIVETAKDLDVDIIVLATHGRTGLSHLVFGSTAEKVVRLAPCPVLTVKHPEHEFIKPPV